MYQATHTENQDLKRRRTAPNAFNSMPQSSSNRRRVNPESLAQRLGPVLVRELNSLIYPGMTEMPPFAVRQEIQKRFNVNRRHIYDYFHSKGLRVTKECERRLALDSAAAQSLPRKMRRAPEHDGSPTLPALTYSSSEDGSDSSRSTPTRLLTPGPSDHVFGLAPQEKTSVCGGPVSASLDDLHESWMYPTPAGLVSSGSVSVLPASVTVEKDLLAPAHVKRLVSQLQQLQGLGKFPRPQPTATNEKLDVLKPLDEEAALTQSEREAFYSCLSDVLGPASGIQESVGTYKAYMDKQNEIYYERLLPKNPVEQPSTDKQEKENMSPTGSVPQPAPSASSVNLTARPSSSGTSVSVQPQYSPQGALPAVPSGAPYMAGGAGFAGEGPFSGASLPQGAVVPDTSMEYSFALWPSDMTNASDSTDPAPLDLSDILDNSVLRSRNPSCAPAPATHTLEDFCIPASALPFYSAIPYSFPTSDFAGFQFSYYPAPPPRMAHPPRGRASARSYIPMPPTYAVFGM